MQKDFDKAVLENERKERLHAVVDDVSKSSGGSGLEFSGIDSANTPLLKDQQRVHVMRVGGKEVVQHDVAAVEAVSSVFCETDFVFHIRCAVFLPVLPGVSPEYPAQQYQQEQLSAFTRLESDLVGLAEVYQEVATLTVEQGVAIDTVRATRVLWCMRVLLFDLKKHAIFLAFNHRQCSNGSSCQSSPVFERRE